MAWDPEFEIAFTPRSVAVLGASTRDRGRANGFIWGMQEMEYPGRIYPVNPNADEIMGYKCYPSLAAVPEVPDLVIMAVGAGRAEQALEDCIAKGARNIHMFTAGFAETGEEEGAQLAERLREVAARGRLNIVGPNCMGIYSPRGRISPWGKLPAEVGPIAFLTQSGALGSEFVRLVPDHGLRMSKVISYGNGYVLDCTDFLEYLERDPDTKIIAMYLEGVRDGRKLLRMVQRISLTKPVVILKGGLTAAGAKAAASHTGSLAGEGAIWDAFYAQSGAIRVDSMEEMVDVLQALVRLPPCTGRGVALVGGAGGTSVAATDICARAGLSVPTITEETQRELRTFIGVAGTSVQNPLDIGMQLRGPDDLIHVLEVVAKDPQIDLLLMVVYVFQRGVPWRGGATDMLRPLLKFARGSSHRQPFAVAIRAPAENREAETDRLRTTRAFLAANVPVFKTVERACRALYKYTGYYRSLQERQAP
ncbi:MAG: CoA-binding protein [Dehalococcoidia bacterium]|jgi:acyl-CoA synthetase (NDP forming)